MTARRRAGALLRTGMLAVALAATASAQRPPLRTVEAPIDFSAGQDDNLFSVVRSQEQIHAFEQGLADDAAGELRAGVERLHRVLQGDAAGVVPVAPGRFLGLRLCVTQALANLPPAARAAYEELVAREGGGATDLAALDAEALRALADRFPAADVGLRARLRLGDLALADGDARTAAGRFRQALDAAAIGSDEERRAAERLFCAQTLLEPAHALGLRRQGRLAAAGDDALGALPPARLLRQDWPAVGGPGSGAAAMASPPRRIDTRWSAEVGAPGFDERLISQYAMHAVGDLDGVYVATGQQVVAFDPLRKETLWASIAPMREVGEEPAAPQGFGRRRRGGDDGINEDMTLAAAVGDDVVVAALQVPEKSMNVDFQGGFRVMSKIPMRRLHGFARGSGKVLWAHYDELDGPRTRRYRGNDACGAPLVAGDLVYAPVHDRSGAIAFAIAAYDLRTGEQRWRRLICSSQQDVNMFGNARAEFAASPLALHQGVLYGASNLGVAFAVDAATGALRWLSSYDVVRMPRVSFHQQAERQVYFANNPPAVTDGVVCMTPLDSQFVLGFDAESGRVLWRAPAEATVGDVEHRVFWLVGAWPGEFVLAGAGVLAVKARPAAMLRGAAEARSVVAPEGFADNLGPGLAPRPGLAADALWFVRNDGLHGVGENGAPLPGTPIPLGRLAPGNFVALDGIAVSLRQGAIDFAYDAAALRTRVEDEARARADDPAVLLRLASLRRSLLAADASREQRAAVQQTYRLGLDAAIARGLPPEHPVRAALQRELFAQAVASAAIAANAGRADALELAVAARDLAPDDDRWADSHAIVLDLCRGDAARLAAELDRLLARMPDGSCPRVALPLPKGRAIADGDRMPVATFVAWQRALLPADPAVACLRWQQLLEAHGDTDLVGGAAAAVARAAIDELVRRHGSGCYEAIEQQAAANLKAAGDAPGFLRELAARYPNSAAAATARVRLLDAAVRAGDLGAALAALTPTAAAGEPSPGTLRRVQVAALARGNRGLAAALAQRLARHASVRSDWPDDQGATLGDVAAVALAPTAPPALEVPQRDVVALRPPNGADVLMLTPTLAPEGFAPPTATLLPCRAERELLLIDPAAAGGKAVRQAAPIEFVEHVVQCGDTLVVPDMERVFALDARSGAELWQLPNPQRRLLESLGVAQGVLLVVALPRAAEGEGELVGVEPLTGAVLFRRNLPAGALKPKAVADAVLAMEFDADGAAVVRRIDPVTGAVTASWPLAGARRQLPLSLESLSTRFYPQSMVVHGDLLLLPVDKSLSGEAATVLALRPDGGIAWQWQGPKDAQLQCVAAREQCLVALAVDAEGQGRLACIDAATGKEVRTVPVGFDAEPHNWERSWLHAPAPERLLVHSFADADRTERQLVVVETGLAGTAFALPLAREDGDLVEGSAFGADFLAFATRSLGGSGCRLWCVSLQDRSGMLLEGRRTRTVRSVGNVDAMTRCGDRIALAGARGVLLLGVERGPR